MVAMNKASIDSGRDVTNDHKFNDEEKSPPQNTWTEIEIVNNTRNLSPVLWTFSHLTALYLRDNGIARIPAEISKLRNLTKLDLSKNKLRSLPNELGDMIELNDLNLSYNSLRVLPNELGRLFRLKILNLQGNPLPSEIMTLQIDKLLTLMLDNLTVCPRPPSRQWLSITQNTTKNGSFTVMSYNVLCDKYTTRQMYGYCPQWALAWDYRKAAILKEILQFDADLLSLQEVETEQYWTFFQPELKKNGYEGIFSPKSRAKTMSEEERKYVDGCAIFWHSSKFTLIKEQLVEFSQLAAEHAEGADDMVNRVMQRDNIAVMAILEINEVVPELNSSYKPKIAVTNAHIHWDPQFKDVKVIQTVMLLLELKKFLEESISGEEKIPLIICADMNSMIDSGVIEFVEQAKLSLSHPDFQKLQYGGFLAKCCEKDRKGAADIITHPFKLSRVAKENELPFTNFTYDFTGVLDYIFYTHEELIPLGELGPVDVEYLRKNKVIGFPHPHFPSDHICLVVEFDFKVPSR